MSPSRVAFATSLLFLAPACSSERVDRTAFSDAGVAQRGAPLVTLRAVHALAPVVGPHAVERTADGYRAASTRRTLDASLPRVADGVVHLASMRDRDAWLDVRALDVAPVPANVEDGVLVHADVAPDVDLVRVVDEGGVEELRVLRSKAARAVGRYRLNAGPSIVEVRVREGYVEAVDATGYVQVSGAPMFAIDARGARRDVGVRLERDDDGWRLEATLDDGGLVYPIAVDPVWTSVASMKTARSGHAAVRLNDGRVLVVGGSNDGTFLKSAEIYAPATNTWTSAADLSTTRTTPTATLITANGKVLVVGGVGGPSSAILRSAELFDPSTGTWSSASALPIDAYRHTATYLPTHDRVLVAAGYGGKRSFVYDVATNAWLETAPLNVDRSSAVAIPGGGDRVYVIGGFDPGAYQPTGANELFVSTAAAPYGSWLTRAPLGTPRWAATGAWLGGAVGFEKLFVAGGEGATALSSVETYDTLTNSWSASGSLSSARTWDPMPSILAFPGKILVGPASQATTAADLFDVATSKWATLPNLPSGRFQYATVTLGADAALFIGGRVGSADLATVVRFDLPALGRPCSNANECPFLAACVDGVCCDTTCTGPCQACTAAKKGSGANGTCGPIKDGVDPDAECAAASCTGTTETYAQVCNGAGACRANGSKSCTEGYVCAGTKCATSCTTDAQCAASHHCKAGACVPDAANGTACASNAQCTSGACVDGVCCDTSCLGACRACTAAKKGSGVDGVCGVIAADTDPDGECPVDPAYPASCGADGTCDGAGACRAYAKPGTACGATSCAEGEISGKICNGAGACETSKTSCAPYSCATGASTCSTTCSADADCAKTAFCTTAGTCAAKKDNGESCGSTSECSSGNCVDGVCCNTSCEGQCQACDLPGQLGSCVPVTGKPRGARKACAGEGTACEGQCNGSSTLGCEYPSPTTSCGGACEAGKATPRSCDGKGACVATSPISCGAYACDLETCKTSCTGDADCAVGYRCGGTTCVPAGGAKCSADGTVSTGPDGDTACGAYRCKVSTGECANACADSEDCAAGRVCDTATKTCVAPVADAEDAGGCAMGRSPRSPSWTLVACGMALAAVARRRRMSRG